MNCCQDLRAIFCGNVAAAAGGNGAGENCGPGFVTNIFRATGAMSQVRIQAFMENVKPLQQVLLNRHSGPIIVGSLATGVLIYLGHRWLNSSNKRKDQKFGWPLKREAGDVAADPDAEAEDEAESELDDMTSAEELPDKNAGDAAPLVFPNYDDVD